MILFVAVVEVCGIGTDFGKEISSGLSARRKDSESLLMSHLHALKGFVTLRFRKSTSGSVVPALHRSWSQLVDAKVTLCQLQQYMTPIRENSLYRLWILAVRGDCLPMGQVSSAVAGRGNTDENDYERAMEGIDKGLKGIETYECSVSVINFSKVVTDVNRSVEGQVEQKAAAEEFTKADEPVKASGTLVRPEDAMASELDEKLEKDIVSGGNEAGKPNEAENVTEKVVIEDEARAQDLAVEELGEPPERPLPGDCCGSGCDPCVWDTYNDELRDYLARKKAVLEKFK